MNTNPVLMLAEIRSRELQAEARHHALVRQATCCTRRDRHRSVGTVVTGARARLAALVHRGAPAPCCA